MTEQPTTLRSQAKREQIRAAAQRLFLQQGYAATSMDAVTATAGVSKQTLYRYFPSKDALFMDILQQLLTESTPHPLALDPAQVRLPDQAALEAALLALAQTIVANAMQPAYLSLLRILLAEAPRVPALAPLFRTAIIEPGSAGVLGLLARAADQGLIVLADSEAATRLFVGPLLTYILSDGLFMTADGPHPPPPERLAALVRLFLRAVRSDPSA